MQPLKDSCKEVILPKIDFDSRTLLGMKTGSGGCCPPDYKYEVIKNEEMKKYVYRISITQNGLCKIYWSAIHWITIPKIDDGFDIKFESEVIAIKNTCE